MHWTGDQVTSDLLLNFFLFIIIYEHKPNSVALFLLFIYFFFYNHYEKQFKIFTGSFPNNLKTKQAYF